jgi:hypothetical protein
MQDMNIISLFYLFFRLSPFIVVCFLTLGSVINGEIRGFVYLVGLCFGLVCTSLVASGITPKIQPDDQNLLCKNFSMNGIVNHNMPLGLAILSYSFFYLVYPIAKYRLEIYNIPILIIFPLLLIGELFWNVSYQCFTPLQCVGTLILSGGLGVVYSAILDSFKLPRIQYIHAGSNKEICSKPTKQKFTCNQRTS